MQATAALQALPEVDEIRDVVLQRIEPASAIRMPRDELISRIGALVASIADERRSLLNRAEQAALAGEIVDDIVGLGPLEILMQDEGVNDVLVNGPTKIYVERDGKLELTPQRFRNDAHVLHVAQRIASSVGRRVDESSPMLDARLLDGSRVNIIIPPLSLAGPCISIRKFAKGKMDFGRLAGLGALTPAMGKALEIAARCRLNIIVSGGTGSGKTTLLNALSRQIDPGERIITIEDAAELQLQQPHVLPLETRPANIEGNGEVLQRDLVRNALRMRPDRIILGEVRGSEAFDMMQAMNTGHLGSMSTIHANSSRDALARLENMILMANTSLPIPAIRAQIASAVDLIIQVERMRDGVRRIVEVVELAGREGDTISLGSIFNFRYQGETADGRIRGVFEAHRNRPHFFSRLEYYGYGEPFMAALSLAGAPA